MTNKSDMKKEYMKEKAKYNRFMDYIKQLVWWLAFVMLFLLSLSDIAVIVSLYKGLEVEALVGVVVSLAVLLSATGVAWIGHSKAKAVTGVWDKHYKPQTSERIVFNGVYYMAILALLLGGAGGTIGIVVSVFS